MRRRQTPTEGLLAAVLRAITAVAMVLLAALPLPAAKLADPVASGARLDGDANRIEFVAELSRKVPVEVFTLDTPYRVIVDLPEVKFSFPAGEGRAGKGLVSAYRYGLFAPGKSRIVIDVGKPVRVEKAEVVDASDGNSARLHLLLTKTDAAQFAKAMAERRRKIEPVQPPAAEPELFAGKARAGGDGRPLVVIDPGHGGIDPGAIGNAGTFEKDVVLKFCKLLKQKIEKADRFRVKLTREIDTYIPLHERVRVARTEGADLFISIHADSVPRNRRRRLQARGASIYVLSERASDEEAQALAVMENRADIIAGVELPESDNPVSSILIDLTQRETNKSSAFYGALQLQRLKGVVPLHAPDTRSAGFRVLKAPDIPSVLIELGYISNTSDEKSLRSDQWLDTTGNAVHKAIQDYFSQQVARSPF